VTAPGSIEILLFALDDRRFALPTDSVREIVRAVAVRPLPRAPLVVEGLIDVRGQLVPLFDLRRRFGLPARELSTSEHFILGATATRPVAVRVDRTLAVATVPKASVHDPRGVVPDASAYLGAITLPDGLVLIHDLDTFLSAAEAATLDAAMAEQP
jgi:purine-binding chemotaxis protein CheW